jgi:hypothetical protein
MEPKQPDVMEAFTELSDPRWRKCRYPLDEILLVALSATLCGVEDWETMTLWGRSQLAWLQRLLPFAHGIPSPDTFRRVFAALNPKTFEQCFTAWVGTLCPALEGKHVAIDGKSVRGNRNGDTPALHLVSAWRSANGLTLGQIGTEQNCSGLNKYPPAKPGVLLFERLKGAGNPWAA